MFISGWFRLWQSIFRDFFIFFEVVGLAVEDWIGEFGDGLLCFIL